MHDLQRQDDNEGRETMFLLGGVALVMFGAGLILSNRLVRRYMAQTGVSGLNLLQAAYPTSIAT